MPLIHSQTANALKTSATCHNVIATILLYDVGSQRPAEGLTDTHFSAQIFLYSVYTLQVDENLLYCLLDLTGLAFDLRIRARAIAL